MDGADAEEQAYIPITEAAAFIEANSRLNMVVNYIENPVEHTYTELDTDKFVLYRTDVPAEIVSELPPRGSYLFLYKLDGRTPMYAGASFALEHGFLIGGKRRPFASVPVDMWWYNNESYQGFNSRGAQINTHEIINTIQAKLEAAPHNCTSPLTGESSEASVYEAERLAMIGNGCYDKLWENRD